MDVTTPHLAAINEMSKSPHCLLDAVASYPVGVALPPDIEEISSPRDLRTHGHTSSGFGI